MNHCRDLLLLFLFIFLFSSISFSQQIEREKSVPVSETPEYKVPSVKSIIETLERIRTYLSRVTIPELINKKDGKPLVLGNLHTIDTNTLLKPSEFKIISYEWGVTYSGMLRAGEVTGDSSYFTYVKERLNFIAAATDLFKVLYEKCKQPADPFRKIIEPQSLDDAGAMCAAMIKALSLGGSSNLQAIIYNYINYISKKQFRLSDGTFARNIPFKKTLWLDDLYMSVPALALAGKLTSNNLYYNDAIKQVIQFSERMFNKEKGIYMHGWLEGRNEHPEFHWARANGWALMSFIELLVVLPKDYVGRNKILSQLKAHIRGLCCFQSDSGLWHQLLDKNDSYLETSATAMFTYCIARAIDEGWIDPSIYGPVCLLAWQGILTKINGKGQIQGTCVGTGIGFDPAFYYNRPRSIYAAHSYGPVLLAGSEIINLLNKFSFVIHDGAFTLKQKKRG